MDGLLVVSLVCGWFEWIVDGLTGLRVVSSFTTNADTLSTTHMQKSCSLHNFVKFYQWLYHFHFLAPYFSIIFFAPKT